MTTIVRYRNPKTNHLGYAEVEDARADAYIRNKRKGGYTASRSSKTRMEAEKQVFNHINKLVHT